MPPTCPFSQFPDPFGKAREATGTEEIDDQGDPVRMVLRYEEVRNCAQDWQTFRSGAAPGRIVVPSEVAIRDLRQIPFETDPPDHTNYRQLLEDWFRRPNDPEYVDGLTQLVDDALDTAVAAGRIDAVHDFALPLQSRALTLLLNCPQREADVWINWGTHVFRSEDDPLDAGKANQLYDYLEEQISRARANLPGGNDLYAELLRARFRGRALTHEEVKGAMVLVFAGGRDTVINAVTNCLAYFAEHSQQLKELGGKRVAVSRAVEELLRYFAPLTHMGRVVEQPSSVADTPVAADRRISLCWAAANRDPAAFDRADEVVIDRRRNPHLSFGFGVHRCLGADHARQLLRVLLTRMSERGVAIEAFDGRENLEQWGSFERKVGFHWLNIVMTEKER